MSLREQRLEIEIVGDRLEITIGVEALATSIRGADFWDDEECRITDVDAAARSVALGLECEQEDGSTPVHLAIDAAAEWAVEYGENGFDCGGEA